MSSGNTILRRYICKRLSEYYSQPADRVVGSIDPGFLSRIQSGISNSGGAARLSAHHQQQAGPKSIDFSSLLNEWHWKHTYKRLYKEQRGMWLTPVELFFPYYSNILANFVSESATGTLDNLARYHDEYFEIVELGGGRGTNANAMLNHLRECHSDMYEKLHCYTIFDTSPTLHELQRQVLMGSGHAEKVKLVNIDMMDVAEGNSEFLSNSDTPTVVIACELLDNLPHDKVGRCTETGNILQAEVALLDSDPSCFNEAGSDLMAHLDTSQPYIEIYSPMNDPLLQKIISVAPSLYTPQHGPRWIPTVALGVLIKLLECRPNSSVAFADFDWLPRPDLGDARRDTDENNHLTLVEPAVGDPLVTDMEGNDHPCYLTSPPNALCDILFPTDFSRLASFTKSAVKAEQQEEGVETHPFSVMAMKQREFLIRYGSDEVNKTKGWTGYSPLTDDFGNCSVLVVTQNRQT